MGREQDEEQEQSAEGLEMLGLLPPENEDALGLSSADDIELPSVQATPDQVRSYIAEILQRRGDDPTQAREIAAKWRLGTGEELRAFSRYIFINIFQAQDGWIIHKDVRARVDRETARKASTPEQKARDTYERRWSFVLCALTGGWFVTFGVGLIVIAFYETDSTFGAGALTMVGVFLALMGVMGLGVGTRGLFTLALNRWGKYNIRYVGDKMFS